MGRECKVFQRRHRDGQHVHEKVFNITNHQKNANQNHKIPRYTYQNGYYQKNKYNIINQLQLKKKKDKK